MECYFCFFLSISGVYVAHGSSSLIGTSESGDNSDNMVVYAVSIGSSIVFVLCLIFGIIYFWMKKKEKNKEKYDGYTVNSKNKPGHALTMSIDTDNAKEYSFEILWKYVKATTIDPSGAQKDNTKHLRGATLRLLRTEPKNGALLLLKAYSLFVLGIGTNINIENEAKESLTLGFKLFREKYTNLPFEELSQIIERYKTEIIKNANDSKEVTKILDVIIEALYLEFHNDWLKNFNQKYLLEYDR